MTRGCEYIQKGGFFCPMVKLDMDCSRNRSPCIYAETHRVLSELLTMRDRVKYY